MFNDLDAKHAPRQGVNVTDSLRGIARLCVRIPNTMPAPGPSDGGTLPLGFPNSVTIRS